MKIFLTLTLLLSFNCFAQQITVKELNRVIALKGDNKKLPEAFSIYTITANSRSKMKYEYPEQTYIFTTVNEIKTVEGKYLVIKSTSPELKMTVWQVAVYDDKEKCFRYFLKFPDRPMISSIGKVKDKNTIIWKTPQLDGGQCISTEKISGKLSTTSEKYYDKDGNFTYNGYVENQYE